MFINLRRNGAKIKALVAKAHALKHDLSWYQIYNGMRRAPAAFGLPAKSALWLKYKYEAVEGDIDAYKTMVHLLGEDLEQLHELYEDLATADSPLYREVLKHKYIPDAKGMAFDHARAIKQLDVDISRAVGISAVPQGQISVGQQNVVVLAAKDFNEFSRLLGDAFIRQIGSGSAEEAAVDQFGNDNVRAVTDDDSVAAEDEGYEE
jgi:hypothetical protein